MDMDTNTAVDPFHPGLFGSSDGTGNTTRLIASRCRSCGRHAFPSKRFCSSCKSSDSEKVHLRGTGKVYAFTYMALPPKVMGKPYIAAYIDMDESVRVFAQVPDIGPDELRIDDAMQVEFRSMDREGTGPAVYYVFTKVEGARQ